MGKTGRLGEARGLVAALVLLGVMSQPMAAQASDVLLVHSVRAFHRGNAAYAFDTARRRLIVIGGVGLGTPPLVQVLDLNGIPTWQSPSVSGTEPTGLDRSPAVYDPVRDRVIVLANGSMWSLSLAPPMAWTQVLPAGVAPTLPGAMTIYDPVRDRIVGHGGINRALPVTVNATWVLSLGSSPAWGALATTGGSPPPRALAASLYDPVLDRMIVTCGESVAGATETDRNDSWQLAFAGGVATWSALVTTGTPPSARHDVAFAFDSSARRLVVFGGYAFGSPQQDTRLLDIATGDWQAPGLADTPDPRTGASAAYDPIGARVIVTGGVERNVPPFPKLPGDTWVLSLGATVGPWSELPVTGGEIRGGVNFADYDVANHRFPALASGFPAYLSMIDSSWTITGPALGARSYATFYDLRTNRLGLFGADSLFVYHPGTDAAWSRFPLSGGKPPFDYPGTVYLDAANNRVLVFGGQGSGTYGGPASAALFALDLGSNSWTTLAGSTPLGIRTTIPIHDTRRNRLVFFGGAALNRSRPPDALGDLWSMDLASLAWTSLAAGGVAPSPRYDFPAGYDSSRDRAVIFGGIQYGSLQRGLYELTFGPADSSGTWTRNDPLGAAIPDYPGTVGSVDPTLDRFFVPYPGSYDELVWDSAQQRLTVACPPAPSVPPGSTVSLNFRVAQAVDAPHRYLWSLASARDWPGYPLQGFQDLAGTGAVDLVINAPVPDSAVAGVDTLGFTLTDVLDASLADTCGTAVVVVPGGPPPGVTIDATCPPPLTWIAGGLARGHFTASVAGSSASGLAYSLTSTRAWPGFPISGTAPLLLGRAAFDLDAPVPDTASAGSNVLHVTLAPLGESASDSCTWTLSASVSVPGPGGFLVGIGPNPAIGPVTLRLGLTQDATVRVEVRQLATGRIVRTREFGELPAGAYALELLPSGALPAGMYLVRTHVDGFTRDAKLVVLH